MSNLIQFLSVTLYVSVSLFQQYYDACQDTLPYFSNFIGDPIYFNNVIGDPACFNIVIGIFLNVIVDPVAGLSKPVIYINNALRDPVLAITDILFYVTLPWWVCGYI